MAMSRVVPVFVCCLPLLTACVGMTDGQDAQQSKLKSSRFVGSRLPSDSVPIDVLNVKPDAIEKARKNSLVGPP